MGYQKLLQQLIGMMIVTLFCVGCSAPLATVKTSAGEIDITKVQFADRFPPDCTRNTASCSQAKLGYKILLVQMEGKAGEDVEALYQAIPAGVYVVADNDARTDSFGSQYVVSPGTIFLAFAVKDSEQNFKLVWPDQPTIDLKQ